MSWAKVKKINSNMNVPLDELIIGQKRYVATDTPLLSLSNGTYSRTKSTSFVTAATFYTELGGTLKFKCSIRNANDDYTAFLEIVDSSGNSIFSESAGPTKLIDNVISVSPNETYYIRIRTGYATYNAYIEGIIVGGDIVDYNWISGEGYTGDI